MTGLGSGTLRYDNRNPMSSALLVTVAVCAVAPGAGDEGSKSPVHPTVAPGAGDEGSKSPVHPTVQHWNIRGGQIYTWQS